MTCTETFGTPFTKTVSFIQTLLDCSPVKTPRPSPSYNINFDFTGEAITFSWGHVYTINFIWGCFHGCTIGDTCGG